jgi:predicted nuclease of restriction endonuclease-like (RecB) superfamily
VILERCKESAERQFYLERTKQFGWTKNVLIHQIENKTYEKTLLNQTNFESAIPEHIRNQAKLAVKDEYTFDFLELADEHSERQLEQAILAKVAPPGNGRDVFFRWKPVPLGCWRQGIFH